jgi:hypothetical protein
MAHDPTWDRTADTHARPKDAKASIACILFVAAMGAAFWVGAVWASQHWLNLPDLR